MQLFKKISEFINPASIGLGKNETNTFILKSFEPRTERLKRLISTIANSVGPGAIITFGSFAFYERFDEFDDYFRLTYSLKDDLERELISRKRGKYLTSYVFIQVSTNSVKHDNNFTHILSGHYEGVEVTKKLACAIEDEQLETNCSNSFEWSYESLEEISPHNVIKSIKCPYFLVESFEVGDRNKIGADLFIVKVKEPFSNLRKNNRAKKEKENTLSRNIDIGESIFHHLGSQLTIYDSNTAANAKLANRLASNKEVKCFKQNETSLNISEILSSGIENLTFRNTRHSVESIFSESDITNLVDYKDYWQGLPNRILRFSTPNNRSFGFDLFNSNTSYNTLVLSDDISSREAMKREISRSYNRLKTDIYDISPSDWSYRGSNYLNYDPFNWLKDEALDPGFFEHFVMGIVQATLPESDICDHVSDEIRRTIYEMVKKDNQELLNYKEFCTRAKDSKVLSKLTQEFSKYSGDGKYSFLFDEKSEGGHFHNKEPNAKKLKTIRLFQALTKILAELCGKNKKKLGYAIINVSNICDEVEESNSAFFLEDFYRCIRPMGVSLALYDCKLLTSSTSLARCINDNSPHKLISKNVFTPEIISQELYEWISSLCAESGISLRENSKSLVPEYLIFKDRNVSLIRLQN